MITGVHDLYAEAAVQFLAAQLLLHHAGARLRGEARADVSRLALVEAYMHAHLAEPVSLGDLAAVAGLSVFQLIRMCRAQWGETPFSRLTRLRMDRAQVLLGQGGRSVIVVALACGYGNPAHFATAFRRRVGTSPSRYRADRRGG